MNTPTSPRSWFRVLAFSGFSLSFIAGQIPQNPNTFEQPSWAVGMMSLGIVLMVVFGILWLIMRLVDGATLLHDGLSGMAKFNQTSPGPSLQPSARERWPGETDREYSRRTDR